MKRPEHAAVTPPSDASAQLSLRQVTFEAPATETPQAAQEIMADDVWTNGTDTLRIEPSEAGVHTFFYAKEKGTQSGDVFYENSAEFLKAMRKEGYQREARGKREDEQKAAPVAAIEPSRPVSSDRPEGSSGPLAREAIHAALPQRGAFSNANGERAPEESREFKEFRESKEETKETTKDLGGFDFGRRLHAELDAVEALAQAQADPQTLRSLQALRTSMDTLMPQGKVVKMDNTTFRQVTDVSRKLAQYRASLNGRMLTDPPLVAQTPETPPSGASLSSLSSLSSLARPITLSTELPRLKKQRNELPRPEAGSRFDEVVHSLKQELLDQVKGAATRASLYKIGKKEERSSGHHKRTYTVRRFLLPTDERLKEAWEGMKTAAQRKQALESLEPVNHAVAEAWQEKKRELEERGNMRKERDSAKAKSKKAASRHKTSSPLDEDDATQDWRSQRSALDDELGRYLKKNEGASQQAAQKTEPGRTPVAAIATPPELPIAPEGQHQDFENSSLGTPERAYRERVGDLDEIEKDVLAGIVAEGLLGALNYARHHQLTKQHVIESLGGSSAVTAVLAEALYTALPSAWSQKEKRVFASQFVQERLASFIADQ